MPLLLSRSLLLWLGNPSVGVFKLPRAAMLNTILFPERERERESEIVDADPKMKNEKQFSPRTNLFCFMRNTDWERSGSKESWTPVWVQKNAVKKNGRKCEMRSIAS